MWEGEAAHRCAELPAGISSQVKLAALLQPAVERDWREAWMERKTLSNLGFRQGFEAPYSHQCSESSGAALATSSAVAISALRWSELTFSSQWLCQAAPLEGAVGGQRCRDVVLAASLPCHTGGPWCWALGGLLVSFQLLFYLLVEVCITLLSLKTNFIGFL